MIFIVVGLHEGLIIDKWLQTNKNEKMKKYFLVDRQMDIQIYRQFLIWFRRILSVFSQMKRLRPLTRVLVLPSFQ